MRVRVGVGPSRTDWGWWTASGSAEERAGETGTDPVRDGDQRDLRPRPPAQRSAALRLRPVLPSRRRRAFHLWSHARPDRAFGGEGAGSLRVESFLFQQVSARDQETQREARRALLSLSSPPDEGRASHVYSLPAGLRLSHKYLLFKTTQRLSSILPRQKRVSQTLKT